MKLLAVKEQLLGILLGLNLWLKYGNYFSNFLREKMHYDEYISKVCFPSLFLLIYVKSRYVLMRKLSQGIVTRTLDQVSGIFSSWLALRYSYSEIHTHSFTSLWLSLLLFRNESINLELIWLWVKKFWKRQKFCF